MTPAFTILLPHLRNPGNDAALAIAFSTLVDNTDHEYALLFDCDTSVTLMEVFHRLVVNAPTDTCVLTSSDMFMAPHWDTPMLDQLRPGTWVTNVLVEPGAIGMSGQNKEMDFGRRPDTFRRAEFEAWAETAEARAGEGWVQPIMFSRQEWLGAGSVIRPARAVDATGFTSADEELLERWKANGGTIQRARSFTYHLQRFSDVEEQGHSKRS